MTSFMIDEYKYLCYIFDITIYKRLKQNFFNLTWQKCLKNN